MQLPLPAPHRRRRHLLSLKGWATGKGGPASAPACGHLRPASRRHRRRPFKVTPTGNNVLVFAIFLGDAQ